MKEQNINYSFDVKLLKSNLIKLRRMSGMSIADVVNKSNLTRESIYRWEDIDDSRCPSVDSIISLCNLYNVDIETLLFGDIICPQTESSTSIGSHNNPESTALILESLPKAITDFIINFFKLLNKEMKLINDVNIDEVSMEYTQGYIAFKIQRDNSSLKKPLHFLTIFPNFNRKTLRFVFSASQTKIIEPQTGCAISESATSLLSYSPMGAAFTLGYRQLFSGLKRDEVVEEIFVREKPTLIPKIEDIVAISLKTMWLVIEKKK